MILSSDIHPEPEGELTAEAIEDRITETFDKFDREGSHSILSLLKMMGVFLKQDT